MPPAKTNKTYIRPDNTAVITCPHCGRQKTINADSLKQHKSKLKVKCACQNLFIAELEFRKKIRKPTSLRGTYKNHSQKGRTGNMRVMNVSVSGLEFSTLDIEYFKEGDELTLNFILDDEHRSEVRKDATVKNVRTKSVGCEFVGSGNLAYDGELGFYIKS